VKTWIGRWIRRFPPTPTVDESRFQGPLESYPRHWRRFPRRWPRLDPEDPAVRETLARAIEELPRPWRDVVVDRDVRRLSARATSQRRGITLAQQRAMLNRARATLRERLSERFAGGDG
jgi:DNA-directed RNA polymerase specialized sigma24 family protein